MRKETTPLLDRPHNGGMHRQKAYRKIKAMLIDHGFKKPRLYHLVMTSGVEGVDGIWVSHYQAALKALCRYLRAADIEIVWRACAERDDEKGGKGLHFHAFLLVNDCAKVNPCSILNHHRNAWLFKMMAGRGIKYHFAKPKLPIHRTAAGRMPNYAALAGAKLVDCLDWIAYLAKKRSKPDDMRYIYFSSRGRKNSESGVWGAVEQATDLAEQLAM